MPTLLDAFKEKSYYSLQEYPRGEATETVICSIIDFLRASDFYTRVFHHYTCMSLLYFYMVNVGKLEPHEAVWTSKKQFLPREHQHSTSNCVFLPTRFTSNLYADSSSPFQTTSLTKVLILHFSLSFIYVYLSAELFQATTHSFRLESATPAYLLQSRYLQNLRQ